MKYYFYTCIDQLDLAAAQLYAGDPSHARFALILCDNALELMLNKQAEEAVQRNRLLQAMAKPQFNRQKLSEALGRHFDKKVTFCEQELKRLSHHEAQFATLAHGYRNDLYHTGIAHDEILYPLAWHYHRVACEVFAKLPLLAYSSSSSEHLSLAVRRHAGDKPFARRNPFSASAASLHRARPSAEPDLPAALCIAVIHRLRQSGAAYIAACTTPNPLPRWRERARAIRSSRGVASALQRYTALQKEIEKAETPGWPV